MGVYLYSKLPSEYQEVEYIESNGGQYIDTGFKGNQDTAFEAKVRSTNYNGTNNQRLGGDLNGTKSITLVFVIATASESVNVRFGGALSVLYNTDTSLDTDYIAYTDKNKLTLNGVTQTRSGTVGTFTTDNNLWLLQVKSKNGTEGFYGRLYYAKIWDNGTLIRDFVPCYRKSDSVIGLYDLANNQFYTNSGTGTFSKGSDVNTYRESSLKNASIGYARTPSSSTLAYRPLKSDIKDYSGNGYDLTIASGSVSYSNNMATVTRLTGNALLSGYSGDFTILGYTISTSGTECGFFPTADSSLYAIYTFGIISQRGTFGYCKDGGTWYLARTNPGEITDGKVHLLAGVRSSTTLILYLDGVQVAQNSNANSVSKTGPNLILGQNAVGSGTCTYGNLIVENKAWTQQEITDYYNKTKADYGL